MINDINKALDTRTVVAKATHAAVETITYGANYGIILTETRRVTSDACNAVWRAVDSVFKEQS